MAAQRSKMLEKHIAALQAMKGKKVEAGWFESARYGSNSDTPGYSVAKNARVQNFGATIVRGDTIITIPARPFMRLAWSQFSQKRSEIQAKVAMKMITGGLSPIQGLGLLGNALEAEIVRAIKKGGWQPNSDATKAKKGFDKPLIDTAHMWQSVSSKVS